MLTDLLASLPQTFNTTLTVVPAVALTYDGTACWVAIADNQLRTAIAGGSGDDLTIDLRSLTLTGLITQIVASPGYSGSILPSFTSFLGNAGLSVANFGAWCLADTSQDLAANPNIGVTTSVIYQILRPLAASLRDELDAIESIVGNTEIDRTAGIWLSDYGDLYGVDRNSDELDSDYRNRLVEELIAPRTNNIAMRQIIRSTPGILDVSIDDDLTPASQQDLDNMLLGLPWNRLNPYHFFATLQLAELAGFSGSFAPVDDLITKIKAWGTSFDGRLLGVNPDTRSQSSDTGTWSDTWTIEDDFLDALIDVPSMTLRDIWNDTPRGILHDFLLTIRPILSSETGDTGTAPRPPGPINLATYGWKENPLNDGNATRDTINRPNSQPTDYYGFPNYGLTHYGTVDTSQRFMLLGPVRSLLPYVETIIDQWLDTDASFGGEDLRGSSSDAWLGDTATSTDGYTLATDSQQPDVWIAYSNESTETRLRLFRLNNIGCHTQSPYARLDASLGGLWTVQPQYDFYQDTIH